jgi:hypothetical protein
MMSSDFVINFDRDQQAKDIGCMYATAPSDRAHIFLEQSMALPPLGGTAQLLRFLQKFKTVVLQEDQRIEDHFCQI